MEMGKPRSVTFAFSNLGLNFSEIVKMVLENQVL